MKYSKIVALSAMSSALALILLVLGAYVEVLDLSCLFMASLALMMPLAKGYKLGGFLAYLATSILAFFLTGMRLQVVLPFAMFFGLHPLVNYMQRRFKINRVLATLIKAIWFIATLYVMYFVTQIFTAPNEFIQKYIHYILIIGGALIFIVYDNLMQRFQFAVNGIVTRLKL